MGGIGGGNGIMGGATNPGGINSSIMGDASNSAGGMFGAAFNPLMSAVAGPQWSPGAANIVDASTLGQANTAYDQTQQGLAQQQQFVQALQAQNGIGNQSAVYNQLAGVANGQGPNPAQAMLANATGSNVANQAALMAGQRGSGANTGLIARQAVQQGANTQQQAAGQGAALQSQQSLGALGQMGGIAGQQVGQQAGALNNYNQFAQGQQQNILGGIANQNAAHVNMQSNMNNAASNMAKANLEGRFNMVGNVMGAAGSAAGMAHGGEVKGYADGGSVDQPTSSDTIGPKSFVGKFLSSDGKAMMAAGGMPEPVLNSSNVASLDPVDPNIGKSKKGDKKSGGDDYQEDGQEGRALEAMAHGGKVPAKLSPGEIYIPPSNVKDVAEKKKSAASAGKKVPGKAKVKGDSLKNDTVNASLEEGGMVIPRSIVHDEKKCADFVAAHFNKLRSK